MTWLRLMLLLQGAFTVGITTAILPFAQGLGFAIPTPTALDVIARVTEQHRQALSRGTLGISGLDVPIDEAHPLDFEDSYSLSKHLNEDTMRAYAHAYGMRCYGLRPAGILRPEVLEQHAKTHQEQRDSEPRRD